MKNDVLKMLKKVLLLIAPFVLLLAFTEYKLRKVPNIYSKKKADFERQLDSIKVLVLGSSHSLYDVDPSCFSQKGFNLSDVNQSLFFDTQLTLKYIDQMKNLKGVIITLSYFSFWYQLCDDVEGWRDYYYAHFWKIRYPEVKWYDPKLYSMILLYTPQRTMEYARNLFKENLPENLQPNGWLRMDTIHDNPNISEESGLERVNQHGAGLSKKRYDEVLALLDDFIKECKQRNIQVTFMTPPVYSTYYKYTKPEIIKINKQTIEYFSKKYDLPYYDYFKDSRFTKTDFYDNDHLNFRGAEKFSQILNNDIVVNLKKPTGITSTP